nr:hypothetical protein [Candidatus Cloacimonadota bacterium]
MRWRERNWKEERGWPCDRRGLESGMGGFEQKASPVKGALTLWYERSEVRARRYTTRSASGVCYTFLYKA